MDKSIRRLKDKLMEELSEISKDEISKGNLDTIYKLTATAEKICKMEMMDDSYDDDGYSRRRDGRGRYSREGGRMDGDSDMPYIRGASYAGRGGRGGYSRDEGTDEMIEKLEKMLREAETERERKAIRECIDAIEKI